MTDRRPHFTKILLAGSIGNMLEWYDFALYGYLAPVFAALFFPSDTPAISLISAFGVFAVGFLARPLGALMFGYWGDTQGRRETLARSVILMAVPTCAVGLLPDFEDVGIAAPLLLTFFRFLQGLSVGGEFTGSVTFLVEHAAPSRRGYVGSWAGFSAQMGALLGAGTGALITLSFSREALYQWAWRVPFLLGSLIAVVGWYMRSRIPESPEFERVYHARVLSSSPIRDVFRTQRSALLRVIGLVWLHGAAFYLLFVFLSTYLAKVTTVPHGMVLVMNTVCMAVLAVLIPIMGYASDKVGPKPLMALGAGGLAVSSLPLFVWLAGGEIVRMSVSLLLFTMLLSCYMGPFFAAAADLFPTAQRYTGLSVAYNISSAVFGGTAPLAATLLIEWSGNILAPSYYLSFTALIAFGIVLSLPGKPLLGAAIRPSLNKPLS